MKNEEEKKSKLAACGCCPTKSKRTIAALAKIEEEQASIDKALKEAKKNLAAVILDEHDYKLFDQYGKEISLVEHYEEEIYSLEKEDQELYDRWLGVNEPVIPCQLEQEMIEQAWNEVLGI